MNRILGLTLLFSVVASAQEEPPTDVAAPARPALPAPGSPQARGMLEQAIAKMQAYGRGAFTTTQSEDNPMFRGAGGPFGVMGTTKVEGGWLRHMVWAKWSGREYIAANGRMLALVEEEWQLRKDKLEGGLARPFTLDPDYLFTVLDRLPANARNVVHVESGKLRGRGVVILTLHLEDDEAVDFADTGAVPAAESGFGVAQLVGGLPGAIELPRPELETYLAFFIDAESGDLVRLATKTYSSEGMGFAGGGVQVLFQAGFGGDDEEEEEAEGEEAAEEEDVEDGPVEWRRGFPRIKPGKNQSVTDCRIDFDELGLATPPSLDQELKQLLRLR
ncbi:MAG: hypothetical protein VYE77_11395 [Planctomycetota bacterium]|nr:hypothetical protein [Planctomycetota bacterium]